MTCKVCGTKSRISISQNLLVVSSIFCEPELELRERIDEFARLRNYKFTEVREQVIQSLLEKRDKYGDFYCPCKTKNVLENVCPCEETREGDVEINGCCSCCLFWKR